jgi:hypothetical protein
MTSERRSAIETEAAWVGELTSSGSWVYRLSEGEVAELEAAARTALENGKSVATLTRADFPLPLLATAARGWARELHAGRGFVLLRGFPVARLGRDASALAYFGLGLHLGTPVPQNAAGDLLGHVRDRGGPRTGPHVRLYTTRERQDFHTDGSDIVGLLCLQRAKSGGLSRIVSSVTIYNEILRRRPDLVDLLFAPICHLREGRLRTFYIGWYIRDAQRHPEVPRLSAAQLEMLGLIESIANDPHFHLDMDFEEGDVQLLSNASILHARTDYEDHEEEERKRHLLRLWLTAHDFTSVEEVLAGGVPS